MQRLQRLLRSVDRVQQRSRWLGFPLAVIRKFADDKGAALTTVVAYNAFFALFPLLLVVVTVLGFLLGRDSGFQQRLLGSAVAEFPIIGDQVRDNIHGLRGSGVGLVIGSGRPSRGCPRPDPGHPARDGRDLEHPGQAAAPLLGPAGPRAPAAGGLRRWPGCDQPADLAWQLRRQGGRGGTGQPRGRGRGQRRAIPAGVPGADPATDPDPAAGRWCSCRWGRLAGPAGRRWLLGRPLPAPHQPGVWGVRDRAWSAVLVVSGRAAHPLRRRSQRRRRPTALATKPAAATPANTNPPASAVDLANQ